jgi:hypothetical protein
MTEAEWLSCSNPSEMLTFLLDRGAASERKLRLFACACCREIWAMLTHEQSRHAVESAERYADGGETSSVMLRAFFDALEVCDAHQVDTRDVNFPRGYGWYFAASAAATAAESNITQGVFSVIRRCNKAVIEANTTRADYLRDIFGNPFRSPSFDPTWRTETVTLLARSMYEAREFGAMPVLGDALEEAGCGEENILSHCRGNSTHVPGCWLIDLVLNKA